jgi:ribosomal-protein-serine acetyltransferase
MFEQSCSHEPQAGIPQQNNCRPIDKTRTGEGRMHTEALRLEVVRDEGVASFPCPSMALRPFVPSDEEPLYEAVRESVNEITQRMVWCHPEYSALDAARFLAKHDELWRTRQRFDMVIYQPAVGVLLGSIGISHLDWQHRCGSLGYWVRSKWTNRGIARAAIVLAARFAFEELALNRLEFLVEVGNVASLHAAKGAGAVVEGMLRKRICLQGEPRDAVVLSLLRDETRPFEVSSRPPWSGGLDLPGTR